MKKTLIYILIGIYSVLSFGPLPAYAQMRVGPNIVSRSFAQELGIFPRTDHYPTAIVKGLTIYPHQPLQFDFIVEQGGETQDLASLQNESMQMIKYFLSSLTTPEQDAWVNLSPYEKNRIIPESFGQTLMGRDLLAQDYVLKQMTSALIHPDTDLGKKFWSKVYAQVKEEFGTTQIPINTFNKVWITPDKATVWEHGNSVFVIERHLKVMLEEDYLAITKNHSQPGDMFQKEQQNVSRAYTIANSMPARSSSGGPSTLPSASVSTMKAPQGNPPSPTQTPTRGHVQNRTTKNVSSSPLPSSQPMNVKASQVNPPTPTNISSQIIRDIIIPTLEKEVNEGEHFAQLRQIYNAMILATWYKKRLKNSLLGKIYVDKDKIKGLEYQPMPTRGHVQNRTSKNVSSSPLPSSQPMNTKAPQVNPLDDVELIYQQYLTTFKKGVFNLIKEEPDPKTGELIPRKYFSGGIETIKTEKLGIITGPLSASHKAMLPTSQAMVVSFKTNPLRTSQINENHSALTQRKNLSRYWGDSLHITKLDWMLFFLLQQEGGSKRIDEDLVQHFFKGRNVLNIGLETTRFGLMVAENIVTYLNEQHINVQGIGPLIDEKHNPMLYKKGLVENIPFADNSYDDIISIFLFDHAFIEKEYGYKNERILEMYKQSAREIKRVLKDKGKFYLHTTHRVNSDFLEALKREGFVITQHIDEVAEPFYVCINHKRINPDDTIQAYSQELQESDINQSMISQKTAAIQKAWEHYFLIAQAYDQFSIATTWDRVYGSGFLHMFGRLLIYKLDFFDQLKSGHWKQLKGDLDIFRSTFYEYSLNENLLILKESAQKKVEIIEKRLKKHGLSLADYDARRRRAANRQAPTPRDIELRNEKDLELSTAEQMALFVHYGFLTDQVMAGLKKIVEIFDAQYPQILKAMKESNSLSAPFLPALGNKAMNVSPKAVQARERFNTYVQQTKDLIQSKSTDFKAFKDMENRLRSDMSDRPGLSSLIHYQVNDVVLRAQDWGTNSRIANPFIILDLITLYVWDQSSRRQDGMNIDDQLFDQMQELLDTYNTHREFYQKVIHGHLPVLDLPFLFNLSLSANADDSKLYEQLSAGIEKFPQGKIKDQMIALNLLLMGMHIQISYKPDIDMLDLDTLRYNLDYAIPRLINNPKSRISAHIELGLGKLMYAIYQQYGSLTADEESAAKLTVLIEKISRLGLDRIERILLNIRDHDIKLDVKVPLGGAHTSLNTGLVRFKTNDQKPTAVLLDFWNPKHQDLIAKFRLLTPEKPYNNFNYYEINKLWQRLIKEIKPMTVEQQFVSDQIDNISAMLRTHDLDLNKGIYQAIENHLSDSSRKVMKEQSGDQTYFGRHPLGALIALSIYILDKADRDLKKSILNPELIKRLQSVLVLYNQELDYFNAEDYKFGRMDIPALFNLNLTRLTHLPEEYTYLAKPTIFLTKGAMQDDIIALSLFLMSVHFRSGVVDSDGLDFRLLAPQIDYALERIINHPNSPSTKRIKVGLASLLSLGSDIYKVDHNFTLEEKSAQFHILSALTKFGYNRIKKILDDQKIHDDKSYMPITSLQKPFNSSFMYLRHPSKTVTEIMLNFWSPESQEFFRDQHFKSLGIIELQDSLHEAALESWKSIKDPAMQSPGGIDMNPTQLNLTIKANDKNSDRRYFPTLWSQMSISGLKVQIISMVPVNLIELIGK